jgi:hypothetical protein
MTIYLDVNKEKFRSHQKSVKDTFQNLVPVLKGNGYGFGLNNLVKEVLELEIKTVAVGTAFEANQIKKLYPYEILILEPFSQSDEFAVRVFKSLDSRFVRTISSLNSGFDFNSGFVVEGLTSTSRFGIKIKEISKIDLSSKHLSGLALHLPINKSDNAKLDEIITWLNYWQTISDNKNIWLSHVSKDLLSKLMKLKPEFTFQVRIGTQLWLGDKSFLAAKTKVLAVINDVSIAGYTQKKLAKNKKIVVVSGGTANGIGLHSDLTVRNFSDRLKVAALGLMASFGKLKSPFLINNKKIYFFEPAHMNVSLLKVSASEKVQVGDSLDLQVRYTTTNFDLIKGLS